MFSPYVLFIFLALLVIGSHGYKKVTLAEADKEMVVKNKNATACLAMYRQGESFGTLTLITHPWYKTEKGAEHLVCSLGDKQLTWDIPDFMLIKLEDGEKMEAKKRDPEMTLEATTGLVSAKGMHKTGMLYLCCTGDAFESIEKDGSCHT